MSVCGEYRVRILHYVDNSLQGEELTDFRVHLECCENWRAAVETERDLSQLLRRSRPRAGLEEIAGQVAIAFRSRPRWLKPVEVWPLTESRHGFPHV